MNTESDEQHTIDLAYASLAFLADDGELDMEELNTFLDIALRGGKGNPARFVQRHH